MSDIEEDNGRGNEIDNGAGHLPPRRKLTINRDRAQKGPVVEERLQKVLANAGLGSRRSLEERIETGEVRVNAQVAELGSSIRAGDRVELDGRAFIAVPTEPEEAQVLVYHKPDGEVTTHDDPEGRPTVFEKLPRLKGARWVSIGRLDINTTGLLLLTTDGELANAMMHPSREVEREYVCRVHGEVTDEMLERLREGVQLEDGPAKFDELAVINRGESHSWFRVVLREGRNREVRRLWESQGVTVSRLKRIRYGSVELPRNLRRGHWETLDIARYREMRGEVGLAEIAQTLTLQPVIGVRRASAPPKNEFRPKSGGAQNAWSSGGADEARELRAFDFVREDAPRRGRPGAKKARPGGPGAGGKRRPGPGGGAGRPMRGGGGGDAPRGDVDGNRERNPAARRSFSPGGARGPGGGRGTGAPRGDGNRAPGGRGEGRGEGGFNRGPGARADGGAGRGPGRGEGGNARGPGGRGPNRGPGGNGRPGGRPGGGYAGGGNADTRGNRAGAPGNRGGRFQQPAMPFGFPSDHAYAKRFEVDGNTSGPSRGNGNRRNGPGGGNRNGRGGGGNRSRGNG